MHICILKYLESLRLSSRIPQNESNNSALKRSKHVERDTHRLIEHVSCSIRLAERQLSTRASEHTQQPVSFTVYRSIRNRHFSLCGSYFLCPPRQIDWNCVFQNIFQILEYIIHSEWSCTHWYIYIEIIYPYNNVTWRSSKCVRCVVGTCTHIYCDRLWRVIIFKDCLARTQWVTLCAFRERRLVGNTQKGQLFVNSRG